MIPVKRHSADIVSCTVVANSYRYVHPALACLTPDFGDIVDNPERPVVQLQGKTESSISVSWSVPQLTPDCQASVFDYPPLYYILKASRQMEDLPGFPMVSDARLRPYQCHHDADLFLHRH